MVGLDILANKFINIEAFALKNRFLNTLPSEYLQQLEPLNPEASKYIWDYILRINLHVDTPFKKGLFKKIDKIDVFSNNGNEIKKWLSKREIIFTHKVYLSYTPTEALIIPWGILVKHFDVFYKNGIDDLTVIDKTQNWALLFYHESEIYFGSK